MDMLEMEWRLEREYEEATPCGCRFSDCSECGSYAICQAPYEDDDDEF